MTCGSKIKMSQIQYVMTIVWVFYLFFNFKDINTFFELKNAMKLSSKTS